MSDYCALDRSMISLGREDEGDRLLDSTRFDSTAFYYGGFVSQVSSIPVEIGWNCPIHVASFLLITRLRPSHLLGIRFACGAHTGINKKPFPEAVGQKYHR
jgi:hypothetical protein